METRVCPKCGKEFVVDLRKRDTKTYCSRSCANAHVVTDETKEKIRQSVNKSVLSRGLCLRESCGSPKKKPHKRVVPQKRVCCICGEEFDYYGFNNRHTCYKTDCISKYISLKTKENPNVGGYRPNSGKGNSGWYKGIACQSSYELAWVIYNIDHNIKFQKCKKVFDYELNGQKHKYLPDFELDDGTIIEIKGYYQSSVSLKKAAVLNAGYSYKILYKKDLGECFEHVKAKYGVSEKDIITLYD